MSRVFDSEFHPMHSSYVLFLLVMSSSAVSMIIMCWSVRIMSSCIMSATMSTDFMKFYAIAGIFFFLIESNIGEIVPDREDRRCDDIGKEDLIEHEEDTEWEDDILTSHDEGIKHGSLHRGSKKYSILKKIKYSPRIK